MTALASAAGVAVDAALGEPPAQWHPVARFGSLMQRVEPRLYARRRLNGVAYAVLGAALGAATGFALQRLVGRRLSTAIAVAVCTAGRMLDDEAGAVARLLERGELDAARERLRSLAGRDAATLDEPEICRAVVESLAENCVDAVTASAFWGAVGGAPAVLAHRAVNTLDAMVGYRDDRYERFGWASARLDDVANWVPARLTALAVGAVRPERARAVARTVGADAATHPSPNGGVVEAAFAAALGLRLGGVNRYGGDVEDRGTLGDGRVPTPADIGAAIRLRREATAVVVVVTGAAGAARRLLRSRS